MTTKTKKIFLKLALGISIIGLGKKDIYANNFYVGAGGGYALGQIKTQSNFDVLDPGPQGHEIKHNGMNGVSGHLFTSWETTVGKNFLLGLELSGELSEASAEEKRSMAGAGVHTLKIRHRKNANFAFLMGYKLSETADLYLKTALSYAQWEIGSSGDEIHSKTKTENLWGFRPTIGARFRLSEKTFTSFEYSYSFYRKMTLNHQMGIPGIDPPAPTAFKITPQLSTFMIRFSYKL